MRALLTACLWLGACGSREAPGDVPGPDCRLLADTATHAAGCDPALGVLATEILRDPDEVACRRAIRGLLRPDEPSTRIRSIHEPRVTGGGPPLTGAERQALAGLPLPATLTLAPDLRPGPGVPETRATFDGEAVPADARGYLRATMSPGPHTIELRHAGTETASCVTLDACETVTLILHGARPASHPRVTAGACPGETGAVEGSGG